MVVPEDVCRPIGLVSFLDTGSALYFPSIENSSNYGIHFQDDQQFINRPHEGLKHLLRLLIRYLPSRINFGFVEDDSPSGSTIFTKARLKHIVQPGLLRYIRLAELGRRQQERGTSIPPLQTLESFGPSHGVLNMFEKQCIAWTGPLRSGPLSAPFHNLVFSINFSTTSSLERSHFKLHKRTFKNLFRRFSSLQTAILSVYGSSIRFTRLSDDGRKSVIEMIRSLRDIVRSVFSGVELLLLDTCRCLVNGNSGTFDLPTITRRAIYKDEHITKWLKENSICL